MNADALSNKAAVPITHDVQIDPLVLLASASQTERKGTEKQDLRLEPIRRLAA
jgi:hypothetical protein